MVWLDVLLGMRPGAVLCKALWDVREDTDSGLQDREEWTLYDPDSDFEVSCPKQFHHLVTDQEETISVLFCNPRTFFP